MIYYLLFDFLVVSSVGELVHEEYVDHETCRLVAVLDLQAHGQIERLALADSVGTSPTAEASSTTRFLASASGSFRSSGVKLILESIGGAPGAAGCRRLAW